MNKIAMLVLTLLFFITGPVYAVDGIEKQKIDFLISTVEHLEGAKFIRNGSAYDGKEAAAHLRMKCDKAGDRIKTADDFIRLCASQSYMSGKPYLIKFSDGKVVTSETYLQEKLKEFSPKVK
jgi:hypothetical protein